MYHVVRIRVCSLRRIQKRIFDPRFARFPSRKERKIRNWICNLGNSQEMTCFLLFDELCDDTAQNFAVGNSNSDDGAGFGGGKPGKSALRTRL